MFNIFYSYYNKRIEKISGRRGVSKINFQIILGTIFQRCYKQSREVSRETYLTILFQRESLREIRRVGEKPLNEKESGIFLERDCVLDHALCERVAFPRSLAFSLSRFMTRPPRARIPIRFFRRVDRARAIFARVATLRLRVCVYKRERSPFDHNGARGATPTSRRPPFRMKGEKSRGASRRYCVTCRCGSVCGRQRRHDDDDDANAVVSLSLNYSLTRAPRDGRSESEKGREREDENETEGGRKWRWGVSTWK